MSEPDQPVMNPPMPVGGAIDVLVVEDDPEINELIGAYVRLAGFVYRSALDGETALAEVRHHAPVVMVLDLMLPDFSGLEICRRIKRRAETSGVQVILLTALDNDQARRDGAACGAAEFLTKPFDPESLMASIARHAFPNHTAPSTI